MFKVVKVFHTHIEVYPYTLGDNPSLEKRLSILKKGYYKYIPLAYYIYNDTLYLPRGYLNIFPWEKMFHSRPIIMKKPSEFSIIKTEYKMLYEPRDIIQEDCIKFLLGNEAGYKMSQTASQLAVLLNTGSGKTFISIYYILQTKMKAIIITHSNNIKEQWIETFKTKTDVPESRVLDISSSAVINDILYNETEADYYLINHQTISSFANHNGWDKVQEFYEKIKVGIKIFDESHLFFGKVLMNDFFSNIYKTIYLTATFKRNREENIIFNNSFSSVYKYDEKKSELNDKRRHIIYAPVLFNSKPDIEDIMLINSGVHEFNVHYYTDYILYKYNKFVNILFYILDRIIVNEGKILITTSKIEQTDFLRDLISDRYKGTNKIINSINSRNKKVDNELYKNESDIIISTIRSLGTGSDIKKLRYLINLEPFSSPIVAEQLAGRLREYSPNLDSILFDFIDLGLVKIENQYKSKLSVLRKICKEVRILDLNK